MSRPTNAASADAIKQYLDARYWRKDAPRTHHVWGRLNYGPDFVDELRKRGITVTYRGPRPDKCIYTPHSPDHVCEDCDGETIFTW